MSAEKEEYIELNQQEHSVSAIENDVDQEKENALVKTDSNFYESHALSNTIEPETNRPTEAKMATFNRSKPASAIKTHKVVPSQPPPEKPLSPTIID